MSDSQPKAENLIAPWPGPYGGLPPFDLADPASIETAYRAAIASKRAEIRAIAAQPDPPTFENTVAALEDSGRALRRAACFLSAFASTMSDPAMRDVEQRLAPLAPALEDEIAHDDLLFARIEKVHADAAEQRLSPVERRLIEVVRDRLLRRGAGLETAAKTRLAEINGRLAVLESRFGQNLIAEQDGQVVYFDDEADLDGLSDAARKAAASLGAEHGRAGRWAIPNTRPAVWPVLTSATRREVRERIWRMWVMRGANDGPHDNRPVMSEILRLRGEKARLLGYSDFASLATADRMAGDPTTVLALVEQVWERIKDPTLAQLADLQALADAEGGNFAIQPWDRLFYAEKLRRTRFGFDGEAVRPYLELGSVLEALFWQAGRLHGLAFEELPDAPVCHPGIRVFGLSREGKPVGALWLDLFQRPGKMPGSWQLEYRAAESFRGRVLPLSSINSNIAPPAAGEPVLLTLSQANVLFHEFGHALHMLCSEARYPSLGSMAVPWDFVELPSLLNERWLLDRELLRRFARHHLTGEPIPEEMIDGIERSARLDRVFSLTLDYLGTALVDMRLHLLADGREIDPIALEAEVLAELDMPAAIDLTLRAPHAVHTFSAYAAGVYVYLWSDVMAADAAEAFLEAPGGLYDVDTADRWRRTVLGIGSEVPAAQAYRNFRGRAPDLQALLRRFNLEEPAD